MTSIIFVLLFIWLIKICQYCNFNCKDCSGISHKSDISPEIIVKKWKKECFNLLNKSAINIAPTQSVIDIYKDIYPNLNNFNLIEHGVNIDKSSYRAELSSKPIKILVPGHVSPHKGSLLIKQLKKLDKKNNFEFHFMGTTIPNLNRYGINHGKYERNDCEIYYMKKFISFNQLFFKPDIFSI